MNWYVVQVVTGKEDHIRTRIQGHGIKAIVPKRCMRERKNGIWHNEERTLFPSYVFIYTFMDAAAFYTIKQVPGIIRFLGDDYGPQPIRQEDVNHLLRLSQDGDPLGISKVLVEGSSITVLSGPLQGLEGQIIKVDLRRYRAKVNISLMGEPRIVELGVEDVLTKSES
jgi:transcriptional antiterminator NusG